MLSLKRSAHQAQHSSSAALLKRSAPQGRQAALDDSHPRPFSTACNLKSKIRNQDNPQSEICNPQSNVSHFPLLIFSVPKPKTCFSLTFSPSDLLTFFFFRLPHSHFQLPDSRFPFCPA
ncbi:hypothetical protein D1AOALGA4SA_6271 [Olavius algarvensis Delta 1 endosymbiont]|nr:hypothetical protein D1AOALGA4SA_6271 [Olavius algarvensis Delta 1 endosymbiont]